jgi:hypothetical protein
MHVGPDVISCNKGLPLWRNLRVFSLVVPFGQLDRDALRPGEEDELATVEVHDLVQQGDAVCLQASDLLLQIVDREADMIEAEAVQLGDIGIRDRLGMMIPQECPASAPMRQIGRVEEGRISGPS